MCTRTPTTTSPQLERRFGRGCGLVSPVSPIVIYPSVPGYTDHKPFLGPCAINVRKDSRCCCPRRPACPNHASAEGEPWSPRSVPSRSTHPRRETPIRAAFLRARPRRRATQLPCSPPLRRTYPAQIRSIRVAGGAGRQQRVAARRRGATVQGGGKCGGRHIIESSGVY